MWRESCSTAPPERRAAYPTKAAEDVNTFSVVIDGNARQLDTGVDVELGEDLT